MKLHYRLFATFAVIALLAGVVALYSLNATRQIIKAFEGGEEHFQAIIAAANEVSGAAKQAQSELLLFLGLRDPASRRAFFRHYRAILQKTAELEEMVRDPEGRRIVAALRKGSEDLFVTAQAVLAVYDQETLAGRDFDPARHRREIRRFFLVTSTLMQEATRLANLETDFLNKQFAILNAATINNLTKVTEGQLLLYMLLNDQRDLESFMVGANSLESVIVNLRERVREEKAQYLLRRLEGEIRAFKKAGAALFEAFHGEQQRQGRISLKDYSSKVIEFHERSANIRDLAVHLSNLMTGLEFEKREKALATATSIERSLLFFVVGGALLTLLLGYFLSVSVAEPIIRLKEAVVRIGKGDLGAADRLRARGEIGALIDTIRTMAADLKRARNELLASKEYLDNILSSMSDALCVVAPDCRIRTVNAAIGRLLGYTEEELLGMPFERLFAGAPPFACGEGDLEANALVRPLVTTYRNKDGEPVYVSFSSSPMYGPDGVFQGVVCVAQDITSQRRTMQELRLLATVVEQAAEAIVVCDPEGVIQYVNPAFEAITGYSRGEAVGKPMSILKSGKHDREFYRNLWATLKRGAVWSGEFVNRRKDGTFYEEECTISPVFDESRTIVNYVALKRDVTRENKLERQLQQAQKHEALGTLAGGIAHDFNNILGAMLAYAEGALPEIPPGSRAAENVREIVRAGRRAADLVSQILTFSRPTSQDRKPVLLQPVVKGVLNMIRGNLPPTVAIDRRIDDGCRPVLGDATQLHQVVLNLCANAVHAVKDEANGRILVTLQEVTVDEEMAAEVKGLRPGPYARLVVEDNGCGMDEVTMERIFEPYFTTKGVGEGTGLGLATVHGIVEGHDGVIFVTSAPGAGATFELFFPVVPDADVEPEQDRAGDEERFCGRVLFVDDEPFILQSMKIVLEQMGLRVTSFGSSRQALDAFRADPQGFDLIITDQTMPELTGEELARQCIAIRPDIPVILATGYSQAIDAEGAERIGIKAFMMKPIDLAELKRHLARLLPGG